MNIRKAEIKDVPSLVECRKQQLIDEGGRPVNRIDTELKEFFLTFLSSGTLVFWVAEEDEKIIATSGVHFYQYPPSYENPSGKIAYINSVYTEKEYRGKGIAPLLLGHVIEEAKGRGCRIVRLHASSQGMPVYRKLGFVDFNGNMALELG